MCIRSPDAERAHPRTSRALCLRPTSEASVQPERAALECQSFECLAEMNRWRYLPMFQRENGFDQSGNTGRGFEMSQVRLQCTQ